MPRCFLMIWILGFGLWLCWKVLSLVQVVAGLKITPAFDPGTPGGAFGKAGPELDAEKEGAVRVFVVANPKFGIRPMAIAIAARSRAATSNLARDAGLNQFLA